MDLEMKWMSKSKFPTKDVIIEPEGGTRVDYQLYDMYHKSLMNKYIKFTMIFNGVKITMEKVGMK